MAKGKTQCGILLLQLTGQNLGLIFNSRSGCVRFMRICCSEIKLSNLELKTWPKQLLGSLRLDIVLLALPEVEYEKLVRCSNAYYFFRNVF